MEVKKQKIDGSDVKTQRPYVEKLCLVLRSVAIVKKATKKKQFFDILQHQSYHKSNLYIHFYAKKPVHLQVNVDKKGKP